MADSAETREQGEAAYWRENLRILAMLLGVWFVVPFGLGIWLVAPLNTVHLAGFPLGFWIAQQGAIYVFVGLIVLYAVWMDRVDARYRSRRDALPPSESPR